MHTPRGLPFSLLMVAFSLGVIVHSQTLPLFEGSDEDLHYAYVEHIRATGTLPDRVTALTGTTLDDWTQFIHLRSDEMALSLADGTPRAGEYPTDAWSAGEWIADAWALRLPNDLPASHYRIELGFYRRETDTRRPVIQGGAAVDSGEVVVLTFDLE